MVRVLSKKKGKCKGKSRVLAYTEVDRLGLATVGLGALFVGTWSLVCLASVIANEGLFGAFSSFFKALG